MHGIGSTDRTMSQSSQDIPFSLHELTLYDGKNLETRMRCDVCKVLGCKECKEQTQPSDTNNKSASAIPEELKKRRKAELKKIFNEIKKYFEAACVYCEVCKSKKKQSKRTGGQSKEPSPTKNQSKDTENQSEDTENQSKDTESQSEDTNNQSNDSESESSSDTDFMYGRRNRLMKRKVEIARIKGTLGEHPLQIRVLATKHASSSSRSPSRKSSTSSRTRSLSSSSSTSCVTHHFYPQDIDSEEEHAVFTEDTPDDDTSYDDSFDKYSSSDSISDENILDEDSFDCTDHSSE